ncbi:fasciclin domain-containing protein [Saccharicrinis sp. FJH62]|uniref:fasciclin domain-containing protein n=1 Tax=Saccharicrinis sp. FJH62 TaxID=3344657 RepID=UPI0035D462D8
MMKKIVLHNIKSVLPLAMLLVVLFACKKDPIYWKVDSEFQVISEYVADNAEFTEFNKMLEYTKLYRILSTRGPFTLFLPTDEAIQKFYQGNGYSSFRDFPDTNMVYDFVYNHLIANQITTGDVGLGALRDTNALGDYIVSEFQNADIILNKKAKIIDRDVETANGFIHVVDEVIPIITKSIYQTLKDNPSYSIFTQGLERTGLSDTLDIITFPYGNKTARTRFTVLAIADTTYGRYGITNIDQLINQFTDMPDSLTFLNNGFYRYMEYHCLANTYYLSDFESQLYPILSHDNNVKATITDDYKLNLDPETETYTGFYVPESNYPAKNGALHTINGLLPVETPSPTTIIFEVTDYFDLKQGDYFGKYYMKWFDGENTFKYIKWSGDYLQYYWKDHDTGTLLNDDCLNMLGYWWIEITTPKIMKGKYHVSGNIWQNQVGYEVFVDDERIGIVNSGEVPDLGTFIWDKTERHKIKLVAIQFGGLFWDTVTFTPVD